MDDQHVRPQLQPSQAAHVVPLGREGSPLTMSPGDGARFDSSTAFPSFHHVESTRTGTSSDTPPASSGGTNGTRDTRERSLSGASNSWGYRPAARFYSPDASSTSFPAPNASFASMGASSISLASHSVTVGVSPPIAALQTQPGPYGKGNALETDSVSTLRTESSFPHSLPSSLAPNCGEMGTITSQSASGIGVLSGVTSGNTLLRLSLSDRLNSSQLHPPGGAALVEGIPLPDVQFYSESDTDSSSAVSDGGQHKRKKSHGHRHGKGKEPQSIPSWRNTVDEQH